MYRVERQQMKAVVVYESLWGNTAAVARAIAEGLGPDARVLSTAEIRPDEATDADLIVAGAPVQGFTLPSERMRAGIRPGGHPAPDLAIPLLRSWLGALPAGHGRSAAFDTKFRWSPGSAASVISNHLEMAGFAPTTKPEHFLVTGQTGPLRNGELERARRWGAELRRSFA
ncbi:MAG: flavodoxin [Chloroflexi bacterium]|nr:flavodoxin [Chloroflexota bacterium]